MWQYSVMDVPGIEPNMFSFGYPQYGFTQPTFVNPVNPIGCVGCGTSTLGYTPFVQPLNYLKNDINPFFNLQTNVNPFFGLKTDWNPFFTTGHNPVFWNNPVGYDWNKLQTLNMLGINPWHVSNLYNTRLTEELIWKNTLPFNTPIYNLPYTFTNPVGMFGSPIGFNGYNTLGNFTPHGFNLIDEKLKWGTPITTGLFGFQTTPFNTPIDWKLKTFGNTLGVTTEPWNKTFVPNFSWTTNRIPGPVAVL
jgi:hypothetical protein